MRFFAFLGSLLVLALIAALVLPSYIDWNQFKSRFEQEASLTLGLPVNVKGSASIKLLPLPSVTFTDIEIGASADTVPILVADSFRIDVELAPLLKGNVVVVDMQLSKPVMNVELDKSGELNIPEFDNHYHQLQNANVSLENITISDGRVTVVDARFNRTSEFIDLNAIASAKSFAGPWRVDGTLAHEREKFRISATTGIWQESQQIRLTVDVETKSLPYDLEFNGPLSIKDGVPAWKGTMKLSPMAQQDAKDLIEFRRPGREEAFPVRLESDVEIVSGGANVPAFELKIGASDDPYRLNGNGQAVFGEDFSFRVRAEGQQVNVERFDARKGVGLDFSKRLAIFREFLARVPRFKADGEINLYLPAVVAGDTVIREVGMDLRPSDSGTGWQVNNLEAQLPGRTELRADGFLQLGDAFGYQGDLILASSQPSGFAKWLGSDVSPAIRDLRAAGFSAKASISSELIEFDNVELILNQEILKGSIRRNAPLGQRPNLRAKLAGDAVDFDQLSSLFDLFAGGASGGGGSRRLVEGHNLDLDLKANSMAVSGLKANDVVARLNIQNDKLTIDQLDIGNMDNAALKISGVVNGLSKRPVGQLSTSFVADNPSLFLDRLNKRFGPFPVIGRFIDDRYLIENTQLSFEFEGKKEGYSIKAVGRSGNSEIDAQLSGDNIAASVDRQQFDGKLIVVNDEASQLLLQFGVPAIFVEGAGRAAMRVSASGSVRQGLNTEAALTVSGGYISGAGTIKPVIYDQNLIINGELKLKGELLDIDQLILLSGRPLPGFGQGVDAEIETLLSINKSRLLASDLTGNIGRSKFTGELSLDAGKRPRPHLRGSLSLSTLDSETLSAMVYTNVAVDQKDSNVSEKPADLSSQPVLAGLDADIDLTSSVVTMTDEYPPARDLLAEMEIRNGDVSLEGLKANWLSGKIVGAVSMAQSTVGRGFNGQLQLSNADLGLVSRLAGLPRGLAGKLTLGGTFETAGADTSSMLAQITASGSLKVEKGSVAGVNSAAFTPLLKAADAIKDEDLSDQAENLLEAKFISGRSSFGDIELPFTVATGSLRVNSISLVNDALKLSGSGKYDLSSRQAELATKVAFDPGKEVVIGAVPEFAMSINVVDGEVDHTLDASLFSTYLGMRVSERREREFEAQRSEILERQRLQQIARIYALQEEVKRIAEVERERIRLLEIEQAEQRRREEARRRREELERKRIEAEIVAAEKRAAREAALEAGRRERRQEEIDLLRKQAKEAADRIRLDTYENVE